MKFAIAPHSGDVMPILSGVKLKEIPLKMLAPFASQAMRNHGRTLKNLSTQRGMTSSEVVALMEGRSVITSTNDELLAAELKLKARVEEWTAHPDGLPTGCFVVPDEPAEDDARAATLYDAIKHGGDEHKAWLKAAIAAHFAGQPMPDYVEGRKKEHVCRHPNEPYFVLLGRDPQAPDLVRSWANTRSLFEADDSKIASALMTAVDMVAFKNAHPELGAQRDAYNRAVAIYSPAKTTTMTLLGWRLDWDNAKLGIDGIGRSRWCGADGWQQKDRQVQLGAKAVSMYGHPEDAPSSGPTPWPTIKVLNPTKD